MMWSQLTVLLAIHQHPGEALTLNQYEPPAAGNVSWSGEMVTGQLARADCDTVWIDPPTLMGALRRAAPALGSTV